MDQTLIQIDRRIDFDEKNRAIETSPNRVSDIFSRSFSSVFKNNQKLSHCFFSLYKKLHKHFSISRAVLVVYSGIEDNLKVIALKSQEKSREGLALTIPRKRSLLYKILNEGTIYIGDDQDGNKGNFIERKLLGQSDCRSIAVCPIIHDDRVNALLCLASAEIGGLDMLKFGILDNVLGWFGETVNAELDKICF